MIPAFALREVAVHHGQELAVLQLEARADQPALGLVIVAREAATHRYRRLFAHQGNPVVSLLTVEVDMVSHGFDLLAREGIVMDLDLLQADDIGLMRVNQCLQLGQSCA